MVEAALDGEAWQRYLRLGRPLVHVTRAAYLGSILENGLRPRSEVDPSTHRGYFNPRSGRSYLIVRDRWPIVDLGAEPRVLGVDTRAVDPTSIDPDEDIAEEFPEMFSVPPPVRKFTPGGDEAPGQDSARARWADELGNEFDCSEVTERSLFDLGRVSYRAGIPPDALALLDTPSPAISAFLDSLPAELAAGLPAAPWESTWRTELERSRTVLETTIRGVAAAVGSRAEVSTGSIDQINDTCNELRREIRSRHLEHGWSSDLDALVAAEKAVGAVRRFDGLPDVMRRREDAAHVSCRAAEAVAELAKMPGAPADRAGALAARAVAAASAVPLVRAPVEST
jgi:hypothetical protein